MKNKLFPKTLNSLLKYKIIVVLVSAVCHIEKNIVTYDITTCKMLDL